MRSEKNSLNVNKIKWSITMMNLFKSNLYTLTTSLTLGALSLGFVPAATAASTYDATAEFAFTLTNVTDLTGTQVASGWEVIAFGSGDVFLSDSGVATADGTISVIDPAFSLSIGDGITQTSTSSGTASNGTALTDALTDLEISFENLLDQALRFSFDYDVNADAMTTGDAEALALVDMLDDLGFVDILASADALSGPLALDQSSSTIAFHGSVDFILQGGEFNLISGFVDSSGSASAVPVPASVWLFGSGLLGLVGIARRKRAA